jgi:hypothetical protein
MQMYNSAIVIIIGGTCYRWHQKHKKPSKHISCFCNATKPCRSHNIARVADPTRLSFIAREKRQPRQEAKPPDMYGEEPNPPQIIVGSIIGQV